MWLDWFKFKDGLASRCFESGATWCCAPASEHAQVCEQPIIVVSQLAIRLTVLIDFWKDERRDRECWTKCDYEESIGSAVWQYGSMI